MNKKIVLFILTIFTFALVTTVSAADYKLLAPLGTLTTVAPDKFGDYLQKIVDISIAITAAISVLMLIVGGLEYIFSSVSETAKKEAKERITNAILGILIALSGYLILKTIDPNLLALKFPTLPSNKAIQDAVKPTP